MKSATKILLEPMCPRIILALFLINISAYHTRIFAN